MINLILNWFSIGSFYLMFIFLMGGVLDDPAKDPFHGVGSIIMITFKELYIFSILMIFVASLGNRPQGSKIMYTFSFILFGILMIFMMYVVIIYSNSPSFKLTCLFKMFWLAHKFMIRKPTLIKQTSLLWDRLLLRKSLSGI